LERKQAELTAQLEKPETYDKPGWANQINRELSVVTDELTRVTAEWENAATKLAEVDSAE
jgi:ATP-binding cassette subfamily F protein 3